ncbi:MAG: hypothetical protein R2758_03960 [Bacteroidales bacterium]
MLFSSSPEVLAAILRESGSENTLINDPEFREMEKTMPTKSSFLFYASGRALRSLVSGWLTPSAAEALTDRAVAGLGGVGLSLTPSNDMIYTSLSLRYRTGQEQIAEAETASSATTPAAERDTSALRLLWKVKLEAAPSIRPFLFTNHNTEATEIFIPEQQHLPYQCFGKNTLGIDTRERITGDVFALDYCKTAASASFAGRDYVSTIIINNIIFDKYPVKMRTPAIKYPGPL